MILQRLVLVFTLTLSVSTQAEVKFVSDSGFVLENQFTTSATPQDVWDALVNKVHLWWPEDHTWFGDGDALSIKADINGCFCEILGDKKVKHMDVVFVDPPRMLRMTGGLGPLQGMGVYGALDWKIEVETENSTEPSKTKVSLIYQANGVSAQGFKDFAPIVDQVQHLQLKSLIDFVDKN